MKEEEKSVNVLVHHPQTGSNALGIACQSRMMRTLLRVSTLTPSTNTLDRTKGVASSSGGFGPCVWGCERVKRVRVHAHERTISGQPTAALLPHHSWLSQKLQALARTSTVWITRKWTESSRRPATAASWFMIQTVRTLYAFTGSYLRVNSQRTTEQPFEGTY